MPVYLGYPTVASFEVLLKDYKGNYSEEAMVKFHESDALKLAVAKVRASAWGVLGREGYLRHLFEVTFYPEMSYDYDTAVVATYAIQLGALGLGGCRCYFFVKATTRAEREKINPEAVNSFEIC